jgi:hypothetical protein
VDASNLDPRKRARDADQLLADVERINQLAESYFNQGDFANAREWYARRLEIGGTGESFYAARYRLAASMAQLGEPWPDVRDSYLKAWESRPTRAEPLYAIAFHYRVNQCYELGYQFAKLAAETPLPQQDTLCVQPNVYAWAATDELAICASQTGKHAEAFTLCRRLLASDDLPDTQRHRITVNRDFSVPAMLEAASSYPDTLPHNLIAGPPEADVTVSLIAGPDHTATEQTLNSFLHCCTDVTRVGRFLVIYAGVSAVDRAGLRERAMLRERYPFVEFADCGPGAPLDQLRAHIGGRFWLHLGHGWRFFAPDNYITRLTAVLNTEPQVFQVGINFADAATLTHTCAAEQDVRRAPHAGRYVLSHAIANGPAMYDTTRLDQAAALHTATLDEVLCHGSRASASRSATTIAEVVAPTASRPPKIHRFCITHMEPLIPASWYDDCIALGNYQTHSVSHVSQLDQFWHEARPIAYGAAGSHVLPIAIERFAGDAELIEISWTRKRVLPSPEGIESPVYPGMRELTVDEAKEKADLSVVTPLHDSGFLLMQPMYFENGVVGQHAEAHQCRDLLDYTSTAIELGVLDGQSAAEFLTMKRFFGGVEYGIFPKSFLVPALSQIERVSRQFVSYYGPRLKTYNKYQIRAVHFCSERLGAFLLARHFAEIFSSNIPADIFGYMACFVENGSPYTLGVAD